MNYFNFENVLDTITLFCGMTYLIIILKDYRYDTFLTNPGPIEEAIIYYRNYTSSPVNENMLLFIIGFLLWLKAVYQFKFIELTGDTFS